MGKVYIVGIGPGSREYLLPLAEKTIRDADVLIGARRLLYGLERGKTKTIPIDGNYSRVLSYILKNKDKEKITVLVSGDPGIFSFSQQITLRLEPGEYEVIPGISSMQLAFARIGKSWQDVFIFSLHGRSKRGLEEAVLKHKKVFLFTDEKNNPASVASFLFRKGMRRREIFIFKNLSFPDEKIIRTDIETLRKSDEKWGGLCVMIVAVQGEYSTV